MITSLQLNELYELPIYILVYNPKANSTECTSNVRLCTKVNFNFLCNAKRTCAPQVLPSGLI